MCAYMTLHHYCMASTQRITYSMGRHLRYTHVAVYVDRDVYLTTFSYQYYDQAHPCMLLQHYTDNVPRVLHYNVSLIM